MSFSSRFLCSLLRLSALTPAHSRSLPLTPAHSRSLPHMLMHEYLQENDKSPVVFLLISLFLTSSVLLVIGSTKSIAVPIRITIFPLNLKASGLPEARLCVTIITNCAYAVQEHNAIVSGCLNILSNSSFSTTLAKTSS